MKVALAASGRAPLCARGIGCQLGGRPVLTEVDVELPFGRLVVVTGPNGAGKTTLLRILSGVLAADSGHVELDGISIERWSRPAVARRLAVVPQQLHVPFPFSVRELVAMGRAAHLGALGIEGPRDRHAVDLALAELGLEALAERSIGTLSGGERQRVVLARARAQAADLMLLDEPTAQMDLGRRLHTFEWLQSWLAGAPKTRAALVVTHDLDLAARFADQVLLLARGQTVGRGTPSEVFQEALLRDVYAVEARVVSRPDGRLEIFAERSLVDRNEPVGAARPGDV